MLFSAEFKKGSQYLIKKTKIVIITSIQVCVLGRNKYHIKRKFKIQDCLAVTMGISVPEKNNLILHFRGYHDKEIICDKREDLISTLQRRYFELTDNNLPIYGIRGQKNLKQFCTTDRDMVRGLSKIPGPDKRMRELDLKKDQEPAQFVLSATTVSP